MKAGYGRVSTKDQTVDLQVDDSQKSWLHQVMNGSRAGRPILSKVLKHLSAGDVLVIWKLDRLGRSLKHLIRVVNELMARKIGLKSLNDPIDTTTPQGRLTSILWRNGGRPKGLSSRAEPTACAAETLYRENKLSTREIAGKLQISKRTSYSYLRHRGVPIGVYREHDKRE